MGHYCRLCGRERANEKFSGKGHGVHVCKDCWNLPPHRKERIDKEEALKKHGKTYDFHMYTEAGHGFFYYDRPAYRQTQTMDGWKKIWAFLDQYVRS